MAASSGCPVSSEIRKRLSEKMTQSHQLSGCPHLNANGESEIDDIERAERVHRAKVRTSRILFE
jgi:hypothetical protein